MCISLMKKPYFCTYSINNNTLEWIDDFNYLGVTLQQQKYVDYITEVRLLLKQEH